MDDELPVTEHMLGRLLDSAEIAPLERSTHGQDGTIHYGGLLSDLNQLRRDNATLRKAIMALEYRITRGHYPEPLFPE